MTAVLPGLAAAFVIVVFTLLAWRQMDSWATRAEMARLRALNPTAPRRFSRQMVADLPEPARRYFTFAIAEGTPLHAVSEIEMQGIFALGDKDKPNYMHMEAKQVLAAPHGFVWAMSGGSGVRRISGSDSGRWTRFWLNGLVPVARFGGTLDHARSAFGRYVSEAAFWAPEAILPGHSVTWDAVDGNTARFTMRHEGMVQSVDITVDAQGRPVQIVFPRWSNANPDGVFQIQPFGGVLSGFKSFGGYRMPTHVEAGNFFGTDAYFPFFIADVTAIRFPDESWS